MPAVSVGTRKMLAGEGTCSTRPCICEFAERRADRNRILHRHRPWASLTHASPDRHVRCSNCAAISIRSWRSPGQLQQSSERNAVARAGRRGARWTAEWDPRSSARKQDPAILAVPQRQVVPEREQDLVAADSGPRDGVPVDAVWPGIRCSVGPWSGSARSISLESCRRGSVLTGHACPSGRPERSTGVLPSRTLPYRTNGLVGQAGHGGNRRRTGGRWRVGRAASPPSPGAFRGCDHGDTLRTRQDASVPSPGNAVAGTGSNDVNRRSRPASTGL